MLFRFRFWLFCGATFVAAWCQSQTNIAENAVAAKLDGTLNAQGVLEASVVVDAKGAWAAPYREAFAKDAGAVASRTLFGSFMQNRQLQSSPVVTNADHPERLLEIRLPIREESFVLPIERQHRLSLDLLAPAPPFTAEPDGNLRLGSPGTVREEIHLAIPPDFALTAETRLIVEREFARYQSDSKVENGRLLISREFQLKQEVTPGANRTDVESFWKQVREDQQRSFFLRRVRRADPTAWIKSVPPEQANSYGLRAYQQREYDAARRLFERAIEGLPDNAFAWNNLGRALAALGRLDDAQKAYEQQIALTPNDAYAYNNLALVEERLGHWDAAIASLHKQLEVHPSDSYATSNLPRALIHAQRWAEAEEAASKALQAQPNNNQQRLNAAVARVCEGKAAEAKPEIDATLGVHPSAALLNNAAYYLTECGKENDLAESYIKQALAQAEGAYASAISRSMSAAINSQNSLSTYLDTYGWLMLNEGKIEPALQFLSASVDLAPRAEVYAHLAAAEIKTGRIEEAARHWREATYLEPGRASSVPPTIAPRLESLAPLSVDREWYPLPSDAPADAGRDLPANQPAYFFVIANADGAVRSIRQLDLDDPQAKSILPLVGAIRFPVVQADEGPLPSIHVVRVAKDLEGTIRPARSVGADAVAIAADLAPGEFPMPAVAAPATATPVPPIGAAGRGAFRIGGGVSPPRVVRKIEPRYSEEARRSGLAGTVRLSCVVGANGKADQFKVVYSLGMGLDENAILAVSEWDFEPGKKAGESVPVIATIEVNFRLLPNSNQVLWHLARADFHQPEGATRPTVEKTTTPRVAASDGAKVVITFDINEQGVPENLHTESASDDNWAHEAAVALAKWRFAPAVKDGSPFAVSCTMEFVRGN
jgi:TonB family protein